MGYLIFERLGGPGLHTPDSVPPQPSLSILIGLQPLFWGHQRTAYCYYSVLLLLRFTPNRHHFSAVFEIKCACFGCRVHDFKSCAPGRYTIFPNIVHRYMLMCTVFKVRVHTFLIICTRGVHKLNPLFRILFSYPDIIFLRIILRLI